MMLKYAIALAIVLIVAAFFAWAFLPARHLPGNRVRHLRIRLNLRLRCTRGTGRRSDRGWFAIMVQGRQLCKPFTSTNGCQDGPPADRGDHFSGGLCKPTASPLVTARQSG
jgi:hypothetical protein